MNFDHIIKLSPKELYDKALEFLKDEDYDNYCMHIKMSANYSYKLAEDYIQTEYKQISENYNYSTIKLFYEATKQYKYSVNGLGYMYKNGKGVIKDYIKAKELYEQGIEKGCHTSINNLGIMYHNGEGVTQDYNKAKELYELAIKKGGGHAYIYLGILYHNGKGVTQDYNKAKELYEMAIAKNIMDAMDNLVLLYKTTDLKNDKEYVINYFLKINELDKLKEIYNYDDYHIQLIMDNDKLMKKIAESDKKINELEAHIKASPDGELYFQAKESWDKSVQTKN